MYAIVRAGAKQQKVAVGDVIDIDKILTAVGDEITLPVVLVVERARNLDIKQATVSQIVVDRRMGAARSVAPPLREAAVFNERTSVGPSSTRP